VLRMRACTRSCCPELRMLLASCCDLCTQHPTCCPFSPPQPPFPYPRPFPYLITPKPSHLLAQCVPDWGSPNPPHTPWRPLTCTFGQPNAPSAACIHVPRSVAGCATTHSFPACAEPGCAGPAAATPGCHEQRAQLQPAALPTGADNGCYRGAGAGRWCAPPGS